MFVTSFQRKGLVGLGLKEADDASGENMEGDDVAHGFKVSPVDPPLFCVGVPVTPPNISERSIIVILDKNSRKLVKAVHADISIRFDKFFRDSQIFKFCQKFVKLKGDLHLSDLDRLP